MLGGDTTEATIEASRQPDPQHQKDTSPHVCHIYTPYNWFHMAPRPHPLGLGTSGLGGSVVPGTGLGTAVSHPSRVHRGRFTVCQSWGQRSAGVRKSISERSLSTSFNLMKPLFVKADALRAIPLKRSQAQ